MTCTVCFSKSSELDDGFYSPFEEIIMLAVMIVGVGGGGKIVVELIKHCSKSVKINRDHLFAELSAQTAGYICENKNL